MRWFLLLVLVGCYRPALEESCSVRCDVSSGCPGAQECADGFCRASGVACGSDGGVVDVPIDQGQHSNDGLFCYGNGQAPFTSVCFADPPSSTRSFAGTLNTMNDCDSVLPQNGGPDFCLVTAGHFTLGAVSAVGPRVLLVFGTDGVVVDGALSVAGSLLSASGSLPAGSSSCTAASGGGSPEQPGYGGGGGGSGGGMGGSGGAPNGGSPSAPQSPLVVQGGCRGGAGGARNPPGASGGFGGGAIYLMAGNQIRIRGTIDASGSGGAGGAAGSGGGGGGAGGMIVLDAATISLEFDAALFALGGGGGGGGSTTTPGGPGGAPSGPGAPGSGGTVVTAGGDGGVSEGKPGDDAPIGNGGGGGGGGGGSIRMSPPPTLSTSNVSPPAT